MGDAERRFLGNAMALAYVHPLLGVWLAMGLVMTAGWAGSSARTAPPK